jgi:hypothetical protein
VEDGGGGGGFMEDGEAGASMRLIRVEDCC